MPDTIQGGAYLVNEKWVDAEGKPLSRKEADAAEALHAERAAANLASEQERVERAVKNDPMAQVLASALNRPVMDEAPKTRGRRAEQSEA